MSSAITVHDPHYKPIIMGVVNVTPDSFSDGGKFLSKDKAIAHALKLIDEGAEIIDIGGESTRPGADPVSAEEEIARVVPVIEAISLIAPVVSIDTRHALVMKAALKAGATLVNDISALTHNPEGLKIVRDSEARICLMHIQGTPKDMQEKPSYNNVLEDVFEYLMQRVHACLDAGIAKDKIIVDPGIGFGKTLEHNLILLRNISKFHDLGCEILLGTSRKSFIGVLSNNDPADERIGGSLSSVLWGATQGVHIFRVHDVKETMQALKVYKAIATSGL